MRVLLDTNILMTPSQFGIDIFSELGRLGYTRCLVPTPVLEELDFISRKGHGADKKAAKIGVSLAGRCEIIEAHGEADEVLLGLALEMDVSVATNDNALIQRLKENGVRVIRLRGRTHLIEQ